MDSLISGSSSTFLVFGFICCIFLLCFPEITQASLVPAVLLFGDSLVDVGNNNHLFFSYLKANFPHNGVDYPGSMATGRFSNGMNAADFIAQKVDLPTSPPYLSVRYKNTDMFMQGVNFASGGAGILSSTNRVLSIELDKQIDYYSTVYTSVLRKLGGAEAQTYFSKSLFVCAVANNDMLGYLESSQPKASPQDFINTIVSKYNQQLRRLYNLGARKFLVIATPPLGCSPSQRRKTSGGECNPEANYLSVKFGEGVLSFLNGMTSELSGMKYAFFNSTSAILRYIQKPNDYGFAEVNAACCGLGNLNALIPCLPASFLCANRNDHLFWDLYHPTEITSKMLTDLAFDGSYPYVLPINLKQLVAL